MHEQYPPPQLPLGVPVHKLAPSTQQMHSDPPPHPLATNAGTPPTSAHVAISGCASSPYFFEKHVPNTVPTPSIYVTHAEPKTPHCPSGGRGGNTGGGTGGGVGPGGEGGGDGMGGGIGGGTGGGTGV